MQLRRRNQEARSTTFSVLSSWLRREINSREENYWLDKGKNMVLSLFHQVSRLVPAYRDFLYKNDVNSEKIKTIDDFKHLPILDKDNYISKYSLNELCWAGELKRGAIISESSGTTGKSFLWPRFRIQEIEAAVIHDLLFRAIFKPYQQPSLFVVCFYLGAHIAGLITIDAIKRLLDNGMPGALITPGLQMDDTLRELKVLFPYFKKIILIGYPPFIKDIIDNGKEQGIKWKEKEIYFLFSGESIPETWRLNILKEVNQRLQYGSINIYGSADLGFMGHETPLSVFVRKLVKENMNLMTLFDDNGEYMPPLYQFHPWYKFFEEVNGELVCTANSGIPLIRYNIRDRGQVFHFSEIASLLPRRKPSTNSWHLPFLTVTGRSNYAATLYALNIYPEHIREVVNKRRLDKFLSGRFFLKTVYDKKLDQHLEIHLELKKDCRLYGVQSKTILNLFVSYLREFNLEYNKLCLAIGSKKAMPHLIFYPYNSFDFNMAKMKYKHLMPTTS